MTRNRTPAPGLRGPWSPGPRRRPRRPDPGPDQAGRDRAELPDPGTGRPARRPGRRRRRRDARPIRGRFADLHHEREHLETQLAALAKTTPAAADPALLDQLSLAGDILPGLPPALKARLLAAFDLQVLWNKPGQQATVFAEITDATLQALPAILDPSQDGYHDTSTSGPAPGAPMWDLTNPSRVCRVPQPHHAAALGAGGAEVCR